MSGAPRSWRTCRRSRRSRSCRYETCVRTTRRCRVPCTDAGSSPAHSRARKPHRGDWRIDWAPPAVALHRESPRDRAAGCRPGRHPCNSRRAKGFRWPPEAAGFRRPPEATVLREAWRMNTPRAVLRRSQPVPTAPCDLPAAGHFDRGGSPTYGRRLYVARGVRRVRRPGRCLCFDELSIRLHAHQ